MSNGNEKYINYYVELLGSTLNDAVLRNISLQANAKINQDVLQELTDALNELQLNNDKLDLEKFEAASQREKELLSQIEVLTGGQSNRDKLYIDEIAILKSNITMHLNAISEMQTKMNSFDQNKIDYENAKHQLTHLDTFRNELIKSQKDLEMVKKQLSEKDIVIDDLEKKIKLLQLTPAKSKKIKDEKLDSILRFESTETSSVEDGGSF